jgi:hypothetical protein
MPRFFSVWVRSYIIGCWLLVVGSGKVWAKRGQNVGDVGDVGDVGKTWAKRGQIVGNVGDVG